MKQRPLNLYSRDPSDQAMLVSNLNQFYEMHEAEDGPFTPPDAIHIKLDGAKADEPLYAKRVRSQIVGDGEDVTVVLQYQDPFHLDGDWTEINIERVESVTALWYERSRQ